MGTAKLDPRARTVLEPQPHAHFDLSSHSVSSASIRSLATSSRSNSQVLIYVGTNSGILILLSSNSTPQNAPDNSSNTLPAHNVSFIRSVNVSDSPVEIVIVVRGAERVLVVSDGFLFLVDSLLGDGVKKFSFLKGITMVAMRFRSNESDCTEFSDSSSSLWEHTTRSQRFLQKLGSGIRANGVKLKDSDVARHEGSNVFAVVSGKRLVLIELVLGNRGNQKESEVDSTIGSFVVIKEIQCMAGVKTMVWLDDSIIVGTSSGYSLISCVTGQSAVIFSLPDLSCPPRLKLLQKERKVLLLVDNVGIVVNAQGQPVGGSLVFRGGPDSMGELSSYVMVVRSGKIELYHKKSGNCTQMINFGGKDIVPCVIAGGEEGNGNIIAVADSSKVICYRKVHPEEQVKDLLRRKNFKEAIALVEELESEGEMSKEIISFVHAQVGFLLLFDLHFEEAVDHFLLSETMQPSEVFPFIMRDPNRWTLMVPRNRYWGLHPPPVPLEDVIDEGLMAIQRAIFLRKAGVETSVDDEIILNPPSRASLLESAIKNITRYLEVSRQKELTITVQEGVDTLLMYLYRALDCVDKMEKLASSANCCVVEELETLLDESGHLRTLAFLYASKGMSSKALAIWRVLARNYSSGLWKDSSAANVLLDTNILSGKELAAFEASKILEGSSDQHLILEHTGWIADIDEVLVVRILTSDKRATQLSPDEVVTAIDPKRVEILQGYLQWLIEDQDCDDTQFHTLYALSLAKSALEAFEEDARRTEVAETSNHRENSIFETPVRDRLQSFLQSSDLYDPEEVLDLIEDSELWLEKAILYRKLGQETLVLQILALKLEDYDAAEQYCAEIGRLDAYMQLLDMYLHSQDGKEPMYKAAVRLLHNHGESLDPLKVLETLSPDMPLHLASDTILRMLRARLHHHHEAQIVHNLCRAIDIDARLGRLEERSRHVQINDESLCDSCHARLGTKLFAMYPDDTIVCYKCFRRQGASTSVRGRDFKQDVLIKPGWLVSQ